MLLKDCKGKRPLPAPLLEQRHPDTWFIGRVPFHLLYRGVSSSLPAVPGVTPFLSWSNPNLVALMPRINTITLRV